MSRKDYGRPPVERGGVRQSSDEQLREQAIRERCLRAVDQIRRTTDLAERTFPVEGIERSFETAIQQSDAVLLQAETGAGKTLDVAAMVLRALPNIQRIAMTQPRRDAAEGAAVGIAARHHYQFGPEVSFSTSEYKGNRDNTVIQVQTTAILLNRFREDPLLSYYDVVIIDEAHERDLHIDLCFALIKRANQRRAENNQPPIKLVVASATIDQQKFQRYIQAPKNAVFAVEGRMHPIQDNWIQEEDFYEVDRNPNKNPRDKRERDETEPAKAERPFTSLAAERVCHILTSTNSGDILVFMPGLRTIGQTINLITQSMQGRNVEVLSLHSSDNIDHRARVLSGNKAKGVRRVVVSTNMAETSVTVPGIRYVVDSCRKNQPQYDPETGLTSLKEVYATKAECSQRRGRAGRITAGQYYALLPKPQFERLEDFPLPEIRRAELSDTVLKLLHLGIKEIEQLEFIDPPESDHVTAALQLLEALGLIDNCTDRNLTKLGETAAALPLEPRLATMVATAQEYGCVQEVIEMTSVISAANTIMRYQSTEEEETAIGGLFQDCDAQIARLEKQKSRYLLDHFSPPSPTQQAQWQAEVDRLEQFIILLQQQRDRPPLEARQRNRDVARALLKQRQDTLRKKYNSDWTMLWLMLDAYRQANNRPAYCEANGLDGFRLAKALKNVERIQAELQRAGVEITSNPNPDAVAKCLLRGFAPDHLIQNTGSRRGVEYNRLDRNDRQVRLSGGSVARADDLSLAVCLSIEEGKGRDKVDRQGNIIETTWHYASGLHPVTAGQLHEVMPHRVRRGEQPRGFELNAAEEVLSRYSYDFKTRDGNWAPLGDDNLHLPTAAVASYIAGLLLSPEKALAKEPLFQVEQNKPVAADLDALNKRLAFLVGTHQASTEIATGYADPQQHWPGLQQWYAKQMGAIGSLAEARAVGATGYQLRVADIYPTTVTEELDLQVPTTVAFGSVVCPVEYYFRAGDPDAYHEAGRQDDFRLTLNLSAIGYPEVMTIPAASALTELAQQLPVFDPKQHQVNWEGKYAYTSFSEKTLLDLQTKIEQHYCEAQFYPWKQEHPPSDPISLASPLTSLPACQSLGFTALPYVQTYAGKAVMAYPAMRASREQQSDGNYVSVYRVEYYQTKEDAAEAGTAATTARAADIAKEQRRLDRDTPGYIEQANQAVMQMRAKLTEVKNNPSSFGYNSTWDLASLDDKLKQAEICLQLLDSYNRPVDADPRRAIALAKEIADDLAAHQRTVADKQRTTLELAQLDADIKQLRGALRAKQTTMLGEYSAWYGLPDKDKDSVLKDLANADERLKPYGSKATSDERDPAKILELLQSAQQLLSRYEAMLSPIQLKFLGEISDKFGSRCCVLEFSNGVITRAESLRGAQNRLSRYRFGDSTGARATFRIDAQKQVYVQGNRLTQWSGRGRTAEAHYLIPDGQCVLTPNGRVYVVRQGYGNKSDQWVATQQLDTNTGGRVVNPPAENGEDIWIGGDMVSGKDTSGTGAFAEALKGVQPGRATTAVEEEPIFAEPPTKKPKPEMTTPGRWDTTAASAAKLAELATTFGGKKTIVPEPVKDKPAPTPPPKETTKPAEEPMTELLRAQFLAELQNLQALAASIAPLLTSPTPTKTPKETDKVKAAIADIKTRHTTEIKPKLADLTTALASESTISPAKLRGLFSGARASIEATFKKINSGFIEGYRSNWLEAYRTVLNGVDAAITAHSDAQEYIEAELATLEDVRSTVRQAITARLPEFQRGTTQPEIDVHTLITAALES